MKIILKIYALIFFVVILESCEEETTWKYKSSDQIIVVDALITSENTNQVITINKSYPELNLEGEPVSGAIVYLSTINDSVTFIESDSIPGSYFAPPINPITSQLYTLHVIIDSNHNSATDSMVVVSDLRDVSIVSIDTLYKYIDPGSKLPAITEVYYDWSQVPDFCNFYGACQAMETFYKLNVVDISEEFAPTKQEILFPSGTIITRKKYSLSENHQEFLRCLLIETEWRGGVFDSENGNVPTNFNNGLGGWFAICQVVSDTTFVP